jgi:hypothetical protein
MVFFAHFVHESVKKSMRLSNFNITLYEFYQLTIRHINNPKV